MHLRYHMCVCFDHVESRDTVETCLSWSMTLYLKAGEQLQRRAGGEHATRRTSCTVTTPEITRERERGRVECVFAGPVIHRVWPLSQSGPEVSRGRGLIDQTVRTNEESHVNGTFISPTGRTTWHSELYEYVQSRVHTVCVHAHVCLCVIPEPR